MALIEPQAERLMNVVYIVCDGSYNDPVGVN